MKILDGKLLAAKEQEEIKRKVDGILVQGKRVPGLAVILVGEDPASKVYVANKEKSAARCGFNTFNAKLKPDVTQEELLKVIDDFNSNNEVDGILLQLPLPKHLDSNQAVLRINPEKDVDGLHPYNQGLLMQGKALLKSCTPFGVMRLLDLAFSDCDLEKGDDITQIKEQDFKGKKVIVIGRSILVGKPLSFLLLERNLTVTMAHSRTANLDQECKACDIVVAAVGVPNLVKGRWVKEGAVVIDVGINRVDGKLVGDVDYNEVAPIASAITPVPGE